MKNPGNGKVGQWIREPFNLFSTSLAVFSLLLSIHGDVFEQYDSPLKAILLQPLASSIRAIADEPVDLSAILEAAPIQSKQLPETATLLATSQSERRPLYIFALDKSRSMSNDPISSAEIDRYRKNLDSMEGRNKAICRPFCLIEANLPRITTFDVAREELYGYLNLVPEGSKVAIWTFGNNPRLELPAPNLVNDIYASWSSSPGGGERREIAKKMLLNLKAEDDHTNFESLLADLSARYASQIKKQDRQISEIHFIIISDFAHDLGGGRYLKRLVSDNDARPEGIALESQYRASTANITDLLKDIAKEGGVTFHLSAVSGTRNVTCAILPIFGDTLELFSHRETQLTPSNAGKQFDFLRSYEASKSDMIFYYTAGNFKPAEARIKVDAEKYMDSDIRFALASEARGEIAFPLRTKISLPPKGSQDTIKLGGGTFNGKLQRIGDEVIIEPLSILEPREAAAYRLLVSWNPKPGSIDEAKTKTFAVKIKFYQRLSRYAAISIMLSGAFTLFSLILMIYRRFFDKRSHLSTVKSASTMDITAPQETLNTIRLRKQCTVYENQTGGAPIHFIPPETLI